MHVQLVAISMVYCHWIISKSEPYHRLRYHSHCLQEYCAINSIRSVHRGQYLRRSQTETFRL